MKPLTQYTGASAGCDQLKNDAERILFRACRFPAIVMWFRQLFLHGTVCPALMFTCGTLVGQDCRLRKAKEASLSVDSVRGKPLKSFSN
jgi:hypothetical protein